MIRERIINKDILDIYYLPSETGFYKNLKYFYTSKSQIYEAINDYTINKNKILFKLFGFKLEIYDIKFLDITVDIIHKATPL